MSTIYNHAHALYQDQFEMLRGQLVSCFEVPVRADYELQRIHSGRYLGCFPTTPVRR